MWTAASLLDCHPGRAARDRAPMQVACQRNRRQNLTKGSIGPICEARQHAGLPRFWLFATLARPRAGAPRRRSGAWARFKAPECAQRMCNWRDGPLPAPLRGRLDGEWHPPGEARLGAGSVGADEGRHDAARPVAAHIACACMSHRSSRCRCAMATGWRTRSHRTVRQGPADRRAPGGHLGTVVTGGRPQFTQSMRRCVPGDGVVFKCSSSASRSTMPPSRSRPLLSSSNPSPPSAR